MKEFKKYGKITFASNGSDVSELLELDGVDDEQAIRDRIVEVSAYSDTDSYLVEMVYQYTEPAPAPMI